MVYKYDEQKPIPDLKTFREELVVDLLMSVFFQHQSDREYDMLHLPPIVAPSMIGMAVNNDISKKTLMEKEFKYEEDTLVKFQEMISKKEVNLKNIGDLDKKRLKEIAERIGVYNPKKTGEMMKTDIVNLTNIILCGQGICHSYTYKRGRTGGWQDLWCEHECKVGLKLQACQESVSDPADLLLSLRKLPPLGMMFKYSYSTIIKFFCLV